MTAADVVAALGFPPEAVIDKRIPKSSLVEHAKLTAADKRTVTADVDELRWEATLKDTTAGIPAFTDPDYSYTEIVAVSARLRDHARMPRINLLIHRATQYPLVLITGHQDTVILSLAPKRRSHSQDDALVIDGSPVEIALTDGARPRAEQLFLGSLPLARQSAGNLRDLYWRWIEAIESLQAARITGTFALPLSAGQAAARRTALLEYARLGADIATLRRQAAAERQMRRKIELNAKIKSLRAEQASAQSDL